MSRPRAVDRLMAALSRLPGVGPKTSERLAYHLLRVVPEEAEELADSIREARRSTAVCSRCFNLDDRDPCSICADEGRDRSLLLVTEDARDVAAFEEAGFRGVYHVLQGRVSSLEGVAPEDLTVDQLVRRARAGAVREVCLAMDPDLEGEATARLLRERLAGAGVRVTRLARGLPAGSSIRQVSQSILMDAVEGRQPMREEPA